MSAFENPAQLIRSWSLQGAFSSGAVVVDKLVPRKFARIRTPFVNTWKSEAVSSQLDWGVQAFSFFLPESLRVVSSVFLEIPLPALGAGGYKKIPGFHAIQSIRFLSAGQESYHCEVGQYLRDYVESCTAEEADRFVKTYLGYTSDAGTTAARTCTFPFCSRTRRTCRGTAATCEATAFGPVTREATAWKFRSLWGQPHKWSRTRGTHRPPSPTPVI